MKITLQESERMKELAGLKMEATPSVFNGTYTLEETKPGSGKFQIRFGNVDTGVFMMMDVTDKVVYGMSGVDVQDLFQKMVDDQVKRGKM